MGLTVGSAQILRNYGSKISTPRCVRYLDDELSVWRLGTFVNSRRAERPACLE